MKKRKLAIATVVVILSTLSIAKDKKKGAVPDIVLKAETVAVVIDPEAGEPVTNPGANRQAEEAVERALMKWGRLRPQVDAQTADLVIAVRTGHQGLVTPTIGGGGIDNRPVILQPTDGGIRLGSQTGAPPGTTRGQQDQTPHMSTEIAPQQDVFEVYLGRTDYPLDRVPIWRYRAKNALQSPTVTAVEKFREAIEETEKQKKP
jgi:hypothetical protein